MNKDFFPQDYLPETKFRRLLPRRKLKVRALLHHGGALDLNHGHHGLHIESMHREILQ
jgi:hypothetical protein